MRNHPHVSHVDGKQNLHLLRTQHRLHVDSRPDVVLLSL